MKVLFINNLGAGFADFVDVENDMTIETFFRQKMVNESVNDYLIRVNRQPVPHNYVLQENDRVTITPLKIEGAA